jgi:transcriptional regulator GlxA family with amidase domain
MAIKVGLVVFPDFELLDLAVLTVFDLANMLRPDSYEVEVISSAGGAVVGSSRVSVETRPFGELGYDTLLVAGAVYPKPGEPAFLEQLRGASAKARRTGSICTGAFLLAEAGLLHGRRATTHWAHAENLQKAYPSVRVVADKIFINDGPIWTSAGMTACIDLALALVEEDIGAELARMIARIMVVYHRRSGGQTQFSAMAQLDSDLDRIRRTLNFAKENLREPLTVDHLANHVNWSVGHFSRAFKRETGCSPAKAIEKMRIEAAKELLEAGNLSVRYIAAHTGFGDEERMRRAFVRVLGTSPQAIARDAKRREESDA